MILEGRLILGIFKDYETGEVLPIEAELDYYLEAFEEFKKNHPFFDFKVIQLLYRGDTEENIIELLNKYMSLKNNEKYKDFLLGVDLVGDETAQKSENFAGLLEKYKAEHKNGSTLNFYLHAGESNQEENNNILDNLILHCSRIGHGINLIKHPYLFDEVKSKKICLEICPLSNQILNYVDDLRHHPIKTFINYGIRCSINSDDNLVFDTRLINDDFYVCAILMNFNLIDFKQVCYNSITHSSMNDVELYQYLDEWKDRWSKYVDNILAQEI